MKFSLVYNFTPTHIRIAKKYKAIKYQDFKTITSTNIITSSMNISPWVVKIYAERHLKQTLN